MNINTFTNVTNVSLYCIQIQHFALFSADDSSKSWLKYKHLLF